MISGEESPAEKPPKGPNRFTRGRRRIGQGFTDGVDGVKNVGKHWRWLAAGAALLVAAENTHTIVGAFEGDHPVKVTGDLQGEPKNLLEETKSLDERTDVYYPAAYEGILKICEPIAQSRSRECKQVTVFVTKADTDEGRAVRDGNELTIQENLIGESRPRDIISHEPINKER